MDEAAGYGVWHPGGHSRSIREEEEHSVDNVSFF